ncbi:MAG: STAS domain-containing protein, partial [Bacillota bacterium]|nr:STAS domain-containing protein [Bacillota bacterium]
TATVKGDFDLSVCEDSKERIIEEIEKNRVNRIIFDLGDCDFIDSSGLGLILLCYKKTSPNGGGVGVKNLKPELERFFTMAGLEKIVSIALVKEVPNGGR